MTYPSFFDELVKLGFISDDEARGSLDRLETLEANKPTIRQVARYSGIGAAAAPAVNSLKNVLRGDGHVFTGSGFKAKARGVLADAAGGAILTGAIPLARTQLDRRAETKRLRQYLKEREGH